MNSETFLSERCAFEICPICYWEDVVRGGPNKDLNLTDAQPSRSPAERAARSSAASRSPGASAPCPTRGYSHREGVAHVLGGGADVLVRWKTPAGLPLETRAGRPMDALDWLRALPGHRPGERADFVEGDLGALVGQGGERDELGVAEAGVLGGLSVGGGGE